MLRSRIVVDALENALREIDDRGGKALARARHPFDRRRPTPYPAARW